MPIVVSCRACGKKLNAPDRLAGKRVKCPSCAAAVQIPGAGGAATASAAPAAQQLPPAGRGTAAAAWYAEASDGTQHGPLTADQLRRLLTEGRLDEFSRVRKQGSDQWQWLEQAFPDLGTRAGEGSQPRKTAGDRTPDRSAAGERLRPCPDCGKMISRRAQECPHCGCPVTGAEESKPAANTGDPETMSTLGVESHPSPARFDGVRKTWVAAGVVLALVVISIPVSVVAYLLLSREQPPPPEPAPPPKPVAVEPQPLPAVSAAEKQQWVQEVAAATAKELDDLYRRVHMATAMMDRAQEGIKLIETLAQSGKFPDAAAEGSAPKTGESEPYQSQYESLFQQCIAHLNASLPKGDFDREAVQQIADTWAAARRAPLEKQLENQINQQLFLR